MAVIFGQEALSQGLIDKILSQVEESKKTFSWNANYNLWSPMLLVPNGAILSYALPGLMMNEIFAELVLRGKLGYRPRTVNAFFYCWLPGSAITWHNDFPDKNSMTIYLSKDWHPNHGGYFCWRDWDDMLRRHDFSAPPAEGRMRMPLFNHYVYMTDAEWHATTITAANAPPRLSLQMFFGKE